MHTSINYVPARQRACVEICNKIVPQAYPGRRLPHTSTLNQIDDTQKDNGTNDGNHQAGE